VVVKCRFAAVVSFDFPLVEFDKTTAEAHQQTCMPDSVQTLVQQLDPFLQVPSAWAPTFGSSNSASSTVTNYTY